MHMSVYISALQCPLVRPPPAAVPSVGHIPWENPGAEQLSAPALFFSLSLSGNIPPFITNPSIINSNNTLEECEVCQNSRSDYLTILAELHVSIK